MIACVECGTDHSAVIAAVVAALPLAWVVVAQAKDKISTVWRKVKR